MRKRLLTSIERASWEPGIRVSPPGAESRSRVWAAMPKPTKRLPTVSGRAGDLPASTRARLAWSYGFAALSA